MAIFSFDKTNKKNLKARGNYGVRVARPGYDAESCAQNQLIFNSNWPILQIAKVIDLEKKPNAKTAYWDIANRRWVENPDLRGLTKTSFYYDEYISTGYKVICSGRNSLYYTYDFGAYASGYQYKYYYFDSYEYKHNLGYVPFYFVSEEVSSVENKVVLTSVDISKDVDYPYTEGALPLISKIGDYGISSTSCFNNPRVPGLCSNMFSKLVQAVKTNETCRWLQQGQYGDGYDRILCWSPFNSEDEVKAGKVNEFEAYIFTATKCPFIRPDGGFSFLYSMGIDSNPFAKNELLYYRDYTVGMIGLTDDMLADAVAYTNLSQTSTFRDDASLVIFRSPMVSPEYEERTVS